MRLVKPNRPFQPFVVISEIPEGDAALLRSWRAGAKVDLVKVGAIIQAASEKNAWIACDCRDSDRPAENPPVLFPHRHSERYTLTRGATSGRAEHADQCPFRWEEGELSGHTGHGPRSETSLTRREVDFILYRETKAIASSQDYSREPGKRSQSTNNALQARLFDLLDRAKLNLFNGDKPLDQREALLKAASTVQLFPKYTLADVLWVTPQAITKFWAAEKFRRIARGGQWPPDTPVQGFVVTTAIEIQGNTIFFGKASSITVETPIAVYAGASESRGPYVVIISLRYDRATDKCTAYRAYAHPRFIDKNEHEWSLCPVDSGYERSALNALIWVASTAKKQGIDVNIKKPLFDIQTTAGLPAVRPDFIVEYHHYKAVIETMGSEDAEYRERKRRMHTYMERIGKVFLDERCGVEGKHANRLLIRYVIEELKANGAPWKDSDD